MFADLVVSRAWLKNIVATVIPLVDKSTSVRWCFLLEFLPFKILIEIEKRSVMSVISFEEKKIIKTGNHDLLISLQRLFDSIPTFLTF